jgi:CRISPR-associated protein Cas2
MFVVITYDVSNDKRRARVAKCLLDFGRRVQWSVFEAVLDEKKLLELKRKLEKVIDMERDSVRYYFLCQRCLPAIQVSGWGTVTEDESDNVIIV